MERQTEQKLTEQFIELTPDERQSHLEALHEQYWDMQDELGRIAAERSVLMNVMKSYRTNLP